MAIRRKGSKKTAAPTQISFRVDSAVLKLIDRAAAMRAQKRQDFVRQAVTLRAQSVVDGGGLSE